MNLGLGLRLRSVLSSGGGAPPPSGIPVATVNLVIDFGSGDPRNGVFAKSANVWVNSSYSNYYYMIPPDSFGNPTWSFYDGDQSNPDNPTNPSTDANFIPTSGWINPSITITAA
jgi:hypothetical protein